jgi:hypothetical protein
VVTGKSKKAEVCGGAMNGINIFAEVRGIRYTPFLCKRLSIVGFAEIDRLLQKEASFILEVDGNQIALSWWVSPKRTRSYPYARVYDTLSFAGKRATIIPIVKDEGKDGDRDFLQWDTVSLMSLLGIYTIISYYVDASKNQKFKNKITNQTFDVNHIKDEIIKLLHYQSDALHWNLSQLENTGAIAKKALNGYRIISQKLGVEMHSWESAEKRIRELMKGKETFMQLSRQLAKEAQGRERVTVQPKENLTGTKAALTVKNYLGGYYNFTCDEVEIHGRDLYLIEGKHSREKELPSIEDIKDGLLKMILFTNLKNVNVGGEFYNTVPILKLTTSKNIDRKQLKNNQLIDQLLEESRINGFKLKINDELIE